MNSCIIFSLGSWASLIIDTTIGQENGELTLAIPAMIVAGLSAPTECMSSLIISSYLLVPLRCVQCPDE